MNLIFAHLLTGFWIGGVIIIIRVLPLAPVTEPTHAVHAAYLLRYSSLRGGRLDKLVVRINTAKVACAVIVGLEILSRGDHAHRV